MLNDSCWCQSPLHGCRPRTMWHDPVRQLRGASHLLGSTSASRCKTFTRSLHVRFKTGALQADVTARTCSARERQLLLSIPTPSWAAMPECTPCSLRHPLLHLALQLLRAADCTAVSMVVHYACEALSCGLGLRAASAGSGSSVGGSLAGRQEPGSSEGDASGDAF